MTRRLDPVDAAWLHMETADNPMTILAVLWLDGPVDPGALRERVASRLVADFPRFRRRITEHLLGPVWEEDPAFVVEDHVHHVLLPAPGDRVTLAALVGELGSTPLDLRRSPWELHLVDNVGHGSAIIARVHHAVADGVSLGRVLLRLTDAPADSPHPPSPPNTHAGSPVAGGVVALLARAPRAAAAGLKAAAGGALELARLLLLPADPHTPLRGPGSARRRCGWTDPIPLAEVRAVGHFLGATINDVLVACVSCALGEHLRGRGADVAQLRAFVPVNLRPADAPLDADLGNRFSMVVLPLPVGETDPVVAVRRVHEAMQGLRQGHEAGVVWAILSAIGLCPRPAERVVVDIMDRKASLVLTNVPGPTETLTLLGTVLDGVLVWVPQAGTIGLGISLFSYARGVVVGVVADEARVPDPQGLATGVASAFRRLQRGVGVAP